jgi:hypothetical protein
MSKVSFSSSFFSENFIKTSSVVHYFSQNRKIEIKKDFWIYLQNFLQSSAVLLGSSSGGGETSRKRKGDWMQQEGDFEGNLEAPMAKAMQPKDRDRRKSQG